MPAGTAKSRSHERDPLPLGNRPSRPPRLPALAEVLPLRTALAFSRGLVKGNKTMKNVWDINDTAQAGREWAARQGGAV